jgi:membrane protease subunit HflC
LFRKGNRPWFIRFGKLIRTETEAGLKFKVPGIDNIAFYPKKILSWDGDPRKVPTSEQQYVWVDSTARWQIVNPSLFYEAVKTENQAQGKLDDVIESALKTVISQYPLVESVRSTNEIIASQNLKEEAEAVEAAASSVVQAAQNEDVFDKIVKGRQVLSDDMLKYAKGNTPSSALS